MRSEPVELSEEDLEPDGQDFVLPVELPNCGRIQIVIPAFEEDESHFYRKDNTYWLHFTAKGHYG